MGKSAMTAERAAPWLSVLYRPRGQALSRLQAVEAASAVDWEIVRRFGEAGEPELRTRVAVALMRRSWWLLSEHRVDEALQVGDQLLRRFRDEAEPEVQGRLGEILLRHTRTLLRVGSPRSESVAENAVVVLAGCVGEGAKLVGRWLRLDQTGRTEERLRRSRMAAPAARALRRSRPAFFTAHRKRAAQARTAAGEVIDRVGDAVDRDQERLVATARIYSAAAAMLLGDVVGGLPRFRHAHRQWPGGGCRGVRSGGRERQNGCRIARPVRRRSEPSPPRPNSRSGRSGHHSHCL